MASVCIILDNCNSLQMFPVSYSGEAIVTLLLFSLIDPLVFFGDR